MGHSSDFNSEMLPLLISLISGKEIGQVLHTTLSAPYLFLALFILEVSNSNELVGSVVRNFLAGQVNSMGAICGPDPVLGPDQALHLPGPLSLDQAPCHLIPPLGT